MAVHRIDRAEADRSIDEAAHAFEALRRFRLSAQAVTPETNRKLAQHVRLAKLWLSDAARHLPHVEA